MFLFIIDGSIAANGCKVGGHDGKGLFFAKFPLSQPHYRISIGGIGRQMITAKSLDCQNVTLFQEIDCFSDRILSANLVFAVVEKTNMGSAFMTGIGLGMKTPIGGVIILGLACRAHFKISHGGFGPIIGDIINDRVTGPTVGAIDKRIAIAPVAGVQEFSQTIVTNRDIR